jgi:hypothetical protein
VNTTTSKTKPALVGGVVMGALSGLPIVSLGNACCCLWVICGGVVAAYMLQEQEPGPISAADGATVGLFAGVVGACISLVLSIPLGLMMAPLRQRFLDRLVQNGQFQPEFVRFLSSYVVGVIGLIIGFIVMLTAGVIFSTLGGLLGAAIFRKKTPSGVIDVPPSS